MAYFVGVTLALAIGLFLGTFVGFDRDRAFYPTVTIVVASYYALFAVMGGSLESLGYESIVIAGFIVLAIVGFKYNLWWAAAALLAHGLLDFNHGRWITNPGVPDWWPKFCGAYDVTAAGYLACVLYRRRNSDVPGAKSAP